MTMILREVALMKVLLDLVGGTAAGEEDIGAETSSKVMAEPGTEDEKMKKAGEKTNLVSRRLCYFGG